jgi:hypothetical protein
MKGIAVDKNISDDCLILELDSNEFFENWFQHSEDDIVDELEKNRNCSNVYSIRWSQLHEVFSTTPPLPSLPPPSLPDVTSTTDISFSEKAVKSCIGERSPSYSYVFEESLLPDIDTDEDDNEEVDHLKASTAGYPVITLVGNEFESLLALQRQKLLESFSIK